MINQHRSPNHNLNLGLQQLNAGLDEDYPHTRIGLMQQRVPEDNFH